MFYQVLYFIIFVDVLAELRGLLGDWILSHLVFLNNLCHHLFWSFRILISSLFLIDVNSLRCFFNKIINIYLLLLVTNNLRNSQRISLICIQILFTFTIICTKWRILIIFYIKFKIYRMPLAKWVLPTESWWAHDSLGVSGQTFFEQ